MNKIIIALAAKLFMAASILLVGFAPAHASIQSPRVPQPGEMMEVVVTPDCTWDTFEDGASGWNCPWMDAHGR